MTKPDTNADAQAASLAGRTIATARERARITLAGPAIVGEVFAAIAQQAQRLADAAWPRATRAATDEEAARRRQRKLTRANVAAVTAWTVLAAIVLLWIAEDAGAPFPWPWALLVATAGAHAEAAARRRSRRCMRNPSTVRSTESPRSPNSSRGSA